LSFDEFETLLAACGWQFRRQSGSHRLWYSRNGCRLPIQPSGAKAKGYQVQQFLQTLDEEG
jgi:predicted RNA binding protein YcfA (HicA-like mRNA interferase family)